MGLFNITVSYVAFTVVHVVIFALSLAVCGLYGQDLNKAQHLHKYADSKWVYAVVVGAISACTSVVYFLPFILHLVSLVVALWDFVLFVLWIVLFGVFADLYLHEHAEGDGGIKRMKSAIWIDLVTALLYLLTGLATLGYWWKHRDQRSRFTGRAHV